VSRLRDSINPQLLCIVEQLLFEVIIKKGIFQPTKILHNSSSFLFLSNVGGRQKLGLRLIRSFLLYSYQISIFFSFS
jgi:hypothetical protein